MGAALLGVTVVGLNRLPAAVAAPGVEGGGSALGAGGAAAVGAVVATAAVCVAAAIGIVVAIGVVAAFGAVRAIVAAGAALVRRSALGDDPSNNLVRAMSSAIPKTAPAPAAANASGFQRTLVRMGLRIARLNEAFVCVTWGDATGVAALLPGDSATTGPMSPAS